MPAAVFEVGDTVESEDLVVPSGPRCAAVSGFNLHANVCIPARDRMRLERLFRYVIVLESYGKADEILPRELNNSGL